MLKITGFPTNSKLNDSDVNNEARLDVPPHQVNPDSDDDHESEFKKQQKRCCVH